MAPERMKLDMGQHLRQEQHLTPQLLQSMEVLQMNSQELLEYINRAADENPMLEREEASVLRAEYEQLSRRISWLDSRAPAVGGGDAPEKGGTDWETESLSAFLCDQLERMGLEKPLLALCEYLARLVDEDGYLQQEDLDSLLAHWRERLTPLEYSVLLLRLSECSYSEIARRLAVSKKAVDNAVQRLRRKLIIRQ